MPLRVPRSPAVIISATCLMAGCGQAQAGEGSRFPELAERRRNALAVEEVAATRSDSLFSVITGLDVDSRGRIYAGDWMTNRITVLDADARVVRRFGRGGLGPGEFRSIRGLQVLPGDSLLVYDPAAARLSVFPPDGEKAAYVVNLAAALDGPAPFLVRRTHRNDAFVALFRPDFMAGDTTRRMDRIRVLELDGRPRGGGPLLSVRSKAFLAVQRPHTFFVTPHPFGEEGLHALDPADRLHFLWNESLQVETLTLDAARLGGFVVDYEPPPVTAADVEAAVGEMAEEVRAVFRPALEDSLPARWPAARDLLADDAGRLWIALNAPAGEPAEWAAFDAAGGYLGSVFLPPGVEARVFRGDRIYAVRSDEMNVPQVVVFRRAAPRAE